MDATIESIMEKHGGFAHGGDIRGAAEEWADAGFDADQADAWLNARCYEPHYAAQLRDAGVTPEQAATRMDSGLYWDTVGYILSNGDCTLGHAIWTATRG